MNFFNQIEKLAGWPAFFGNGQPGGGKYTDGENTTKNRDKKIKIAFESSNEFFYLSILGLNERCTIKKLNDAFRKMSKIYHPDYGGDSKMFQKIVKAKNWLFKFYKYSLIKGLEINNLPSDH